MKKITEKDLINIIPTKYANDIFEYQIKNPDKPKIINLIELLGDTIYVQPPWQDDYVDSVEADYLKKWVNSINRKIITDYPHIVQQHLKKTNPPPTLYKRLKINNL